MNVKDRSVLITGIGGGLGFPLAQALNARGAKVAGFDLDALTCEVLSKQHGFFARNVDVTDEAKVKAAFIDIARHQELPRVLVQCHGIAGALDLVRKGETIMIDPMCKMIETNVTGTLIMMSQFSHSLYHTDLIGDERGVIVNVSSIAAFDGQAGHAVYGATQGAIAAMTLPAANHLAPHAIRVMCVAPGIFDTPILKSRVNPSLPLIAQAPHPARLGHPAEFAKLVAHIIENEMLNGETIRLDGALRLAPQ